MTSGGTRRAQRGCRGRRSRRRARRRARRSLLGGRRWSIRGTRVRNRGTRFRNSGTRVRNPPTCFPNQAARWRTSGGRWPICRKRSPFEDRVTRFAGGIPPFGDRVLLVSWRWARKKGCIEAHDAPCLVAEPMSHVPSLIVACIGTLGLTLSACGGPSAPRVAAPLFMVGPEPRVADYEREVQRALAESVKVLRLYPRDFWDVRAP